LHEAHQVSIHDELAEKVKLAAGGERQVSSYVATTLQDHQECENLDDTLSAWRAETPVPEEIQRQVEAELDQAGLRPVPARRQAGRVSVAATTRLTLDTGTLLALDHPGKALAMQARSEEARRRGATICIPAEAVTQAWRGSRQTRLARLLKSPGIDIAVMTLSVARTVGLMWADANNHSDVTWGPTRWAACWCCGLSVLGHTVEAMVDTARGRLGWLCPGEQNAFDADWGLCTTEAAPMCCL
jgi:hypothetical protein